MCSEFVDRIILLAVSIKNSFHNYMSTVCNGGYQDCEGTYKIILQIHMVYVKDIKYYYFLSHTLSVLSFTESVYESSKQRE